LAEDRSAQVKESLAGSEIHETWEAAFRTPENERFYELAFDRIVELVGAPQGSEFLDCGCGPGYHAIRLARRGYRVRAVDFSESVLPLAASNIAAAGFEDQVELGREDLLALSFEAARFHYALCWGVLMHIPDVAGAVAELGRVIAPGGRLVVTESNSRSLEGMALRALAPIRGGDRSSRSSPAGMESWKETESGPLLTRVAEVSWLRDEFARHGLILEHRLPGQFTELHAKAPWPWLKRALHGLNDAWFRRVRAPGPARSNILIFKKSA
jgi:SAM-dependent methyltransferase